MKTEKMKPASLPHLRALLEHQEQVKAGEAELQRLNGLKTSHQEQIAQAEQIDAQMREAEVQIQDLMADIEAGEDKQAELDAVQQRIERASAALCDATYDKADDVLAGLGRKISRAHGDLMELKAKRPVLLRKMLREQAEVLGEDYALAAVNTAALYERLVAINRLLQPLGDFVSLQTGAALELPSFELDSVRPYAEYIFKGHIYRGPKLGSEVVRYTQAETERLATLGVDMAPESD